MSLCASCGGQGNGNHVFWECTEVKKRVTEAERPRSPTDQLQQRCAWPAVTETGVHNEQVIKWMEATTKFIWDCRYGRTETKCTREAAIKSTQRQKNESIADLEKIVTEEDFDHARHDEEVDRREDSADERDSKDIDSLSCQNHHGLRTRLLTRKERTLGFRTPPPAAPPSLSLHFSSPHCHSPFMVR